jgi:Protein of unknown function (DUF1236)
MQIKTLTSVVFVAALFPAAAVAQNPPQGTTTTTGVVGGAVTGAVVGGPVGAVVGAVVGGAIGASAEPPPEVRTYVMQEPAPTANVAVEVVEGQPLAANVEIKPVPKYPQYAYAVVNNRRVIVEPKTRQVLKIYE